MTFKGMLSKLVVQVYRGILTLHLTSSALCYGLMTRITDAQNDH